MQIWAMPVKFQGRFLSLNWPSKSELMLSELCLCKPVSSMQQIRHITSAPYHPATNGLAECAVQILKNALKKSGLGDLEKQLARFFFHYRTTPHSTIGVTPAELLMGRPLRTHLDLLRPTSLSKCILARNPKRWTMTANWRWEASLPTTSLCSPL